MQFSDLPDDLLCLVLERALSDGGDAYDLLEENLSLLAVCQRWRRLALPVAYGAVSVEIKARGARVGSSPSETTYMGVPIRSNLDLVVSAGCVNLVKSVCIEAKYSGSPSAAFNSVLGFMRAAAGEWSGVRLLEVALSPAATAAEHDDNDDIQAACGAMVAMMPGVSELYFSTGAFHPVPAVSEAYGCLAGLYSDRLEELGASYPVAFPRDASFKRLRRIRVGYAYEPGRRLPQINPDVLETLELSIWPLFRVLSALGSDDGSREIVFGSLKELRLSCYDGGASDVEDGEDSADAKAAWQLQFPRLETLCINTTLGTCSLLEYSVLPPRVSSIRFRAAPAVLRDIARASLPAARDIEIVIPHGTGNDPSAISAATNLLAGARASRRVELDVWDYAVPVSPGAVSAKLTHLTIHGLASLGTLFSLIQRLPDLVYLELQKVYLDGYQAGLSVPGPDDGHPVEPLNTKIKYLAVWASDDEQAPEQFADVAKYLLLKIPTLSHLCPDRALRPCLKEFVDVHSGQYPHLKAVKI
ncbi:hypothetical protein H4R18_004439 [Coemansia javaensis]|uniref:F-box domain-containing protein n=1 Tax=Coemansia javaensis TaxID=2761396 RepID=A0A9W8HBL9_9FUNG|nr:hypothetical protein H4R18_004439 [Coemansia javaensis]